MANLWGLALMFFLVAHALVGVLMFAGSPKQPTPSWPTADSWLFNSAGVTKDSQRKVAIVLMAIAAVALIVGALGAVGVPAIAGIWTWLIVAGAFFSLLTLVLFFSPWWLGGIAINAGLILAILVLKLPTNESLGI